MNNTDYKTFDSQALKIESLDDCIKVLNMFEYECFKKECAMTPRDEKWGYGLLKVENYLKSLKEDE